MRKLFIVLFYAVAFSFAAAQDQEWSLIVRLNPVIDDVVPAEAKLEKLPAGDFGVLEGPVWVKRGGYLLFSDMPANVIYKWNPDDGKVSVFLPYSGWTGTDDFDAGAQIENGHVLVTIAGSNGITVDPQGRIVYNAMGDRQIVRLEEDGRRTVLASHYQGKRLNSTNDLVFKSDGSLYFTDPPSGLRGREASAKIELPFKGVYRLKDKDLRLLLEFRDTESSQSSPNGLAFSPDEKYFYVNDIRKKTIMRYEVQPDGSVTNGKVFVDMSSDKARGGPDGMKVDQKGNVYCTGPGGVWILSPEGRHLGTILTQNQITNLAFGGNDGKILYLTGRGLYRIRLKVPGIIPGPGAEEVRSDDTLGSAAQAAALPKDVYPDSLSRLPQIKRENLDEAGKKIYDSIVSGRAFQRAGLQGPPAIRMHSQHQVALMARGGPDSVPAPGDRLLELGVLVVAREMNSQYEWTAHEPTALKAGLEKETIDVVRSRKDVANLGEKEAAIIQLGREMFRQNKVSPDTFARALKLFGEEGLVNLVVHMGDYAGTALLLKTFDQQLRPGWKPLLPVP